MILIIIMQPTEQMLLKLAVSLPINVNVVVVVVWRNIWGLMLWAGGAMLPIPSGESWFEQETQGCQQQQLQLTFTEFYLARDTLHFTAAGVSLIRSNTQTWIMQF